jgi:hypothetical protein
MAPRLFQFLMSILAWVTYLSIPFCSVFLNATVCADCAELVHKKAVNPIITDNEVTI